MQDVIWKASAAEHPARRVALASITAAAGGDREGWLGLFAPGAVVEDPVGPSFLDREGRGHRGIEAISRFWDNVIATAEGIQFTIADSFANGSCCANVGTITMTLDGGAKMIVDCVMIYTIDDSGLITSLRAHWEPERALATLGGS